MTRPRPRGRPAERGAATVLTIAFAGLLLLLGAALGVVQAMVVAHRTAQSAADLAALAGAEAELRGDSRLRGRDRGGGGQRGHADRLRGGRGRPVGRGAGAGATLARSVGRPGRQLTGRAREVEEKS